MIRGGVEVMGLSYLVPHSGSSMKKRRAGCPVGHPAVLHNWSLRAPCVTSVGVVVVVEGGGDGDDSGGGGRGGT